ncbi:hypothetical protein LZ30DRAFT_300391 [Colletotrichum cereale]|nr:hypothetical protein LZ30DRAFT_300391 [Colletotrichum cereale]
MGESSQHRPCPCEQCRQPLAIFAVGEVAGEGNHPLVREDRTSALILTANYWTTLSWYRWILGVVHGLKMQPGHLLTEVNDYPMLEVCNRSRNAPLILLASTDALNVGSGTFTVTRHNQAISFIDRPVLPRKILTKWHEGLIWSKRTPGPLTFWTDFPIVTVADFLFVAYIAEKAGSKRLHAFVILKKGAMSTASRIFLLLSPPRGE